MVSIGYAGHQPKYMPERRHLGNRNQMQRGVEKPEECFHVSFVSYPAPQLSHSDGRIVGRSLLYKELHLDRLARSRL